MGSTIGLDIGASAVRAVEVKNSRGGASVSKAASVPLPEGAVVDGNVRDADAVREALKALMAAGKFSKRAGTRLTLDNADLVVRLIDVEDRPLDNLKKSLRWELSDHVEVGDDPLHDAHPVAQWVDSSSGTDVKRLTLLLVVAPQEMVSGVTELAAEAGFRMEGVDAAPLSLIRAALATSSTEGLVTALVHIGASSTVVAVHQGGQPVWIRFLPGVGGNVVTRALTQSFTDWTSADAESTKIALGLSSALGMGAGHEPHPASPIIAGAMSGVIAPISESVEFASRTRQVDAVVLSGGAGQMSGLAQRLGAELGLPVTVAPQPAFPALEPGSEGQLLLAFGAGLN